MVGHMPIRFEMGLFGVNQNLKLEAWRISYARVPSCASSNAVQTYKRSYNAENNARLERSYHPDGFIAYHNLR